MLHYLAGATIQVANLANYNCHPLENDNNIWKTYSGKIMKLCHEVVCIKLRYEASIQDFGTGQRGLREALTSVQSR